MANSYTDENGVYRNILGITDREELRQIEYRTTKARAYEIESGLVKLPATGYGLARQQAIHRHIFQDVYEWAGKTRTVPSSKRMENGMVSVFANPDTFNQSWQELEKRTQVFVETKGLTFEQKNNLLASIFVEANRIHPFPEGNGRSLQIFMKELAREQGINLDYTKTNPEEWNRASAISGTHGRLFEHQYLIPNPPDLEPIKKIFAEMACPSRALEQAKSSDTLSKIDTLLKHAEAMGAENHVQKAEGRPGTSYSGKIVALNREFALQQVDQKTFILHDRNRVECPLRKGQQLTITYGQPEKSKGIER